MRPYLSYNLSYTECSKFKLKWRWCRSSWMAPDVYRQPSRPRRCLHRNYVSRDLKGAGHMLKGAEHTLKGVCLLKVWKHSSPLCDGGSTTSLEFNRFAADDRPHYPMRPSDDANGYYKYNKTTKSICCNYLELYKNEFRQTYAYVYMSIYKYIVYIP